MQEEPPPPVRRARLEPPPAQGSRPAQQAPGSKPDVEAAQPHDRKVQTQKRGHKNGKNGQKRGQQKRGQVWILDIQLSLDLR